MKQIPLTKGLFANVSDEWYETLNAVKWCAEKKKNTFYASHAGKRHGFGRRDKSVYMHNFIMAAELANAPKGVTVDHIDHNGLNNVVSNLRLATQRQQLENQKLSTANTSGYKGASWSKDNKNWVAHIQHHGKMIHIGCYKTAEEAARAYDAKARELFGEFACTNFPLDKSQF
jgi:hypothetical protein